MLEFSALDKLNAIERELRFRRVVFKRRVDRNAMSPDQMEWEIEVMEAIARDYRAEAANCLPLAV